jgi:hypothetical protein
LLGGLKYIQLSHYCLILVFLVEVVIEKLKEFIAPGTDQSLVKWIKAGGETFRSEVHKVINSIWNKEELQQQYKKSLIVRIYKE